ncbi:MAG: acetyl-CoA carboxylase carboxyltransferase subunit alpha [Gammaproteobacteria bacterium WSBS_2016_MAG_OTU1]
MMPRLLEFESAVGPIEAEIAELRRNEETPEGDKNALQQLRTLEKKRDAVVKKLYANLSEWETCQVARHPARPQTMDYIRGLCTNFVELHGDRSYADDKAMIAGVGFFGDRSVAIIGQQKGHSTDEKIKHNFGMAGPEGYRKALRIMNLAEKFHLPLLTFIDTPGAYPGIGAEERGQSGAIGLCLQRAATLQTPILATIVGEGGSGGALAIAVGDYVGMLKHSVYSVISPEGCASILWKDVSRMADAAALLGLTAAQLKKLRLIDEIIAEPQGGAHRSPDKIVTAVGEALEAALERLENLSTEALLEQRYQRWRNYGKYKEIRK